MASACSGLATETWALRHLLGVRFSHLWVCDSDADVQGFLRRNCPEAKLLSHTNQLLRSTVEVPDVLVAGCPCQPYSSQGKRLGSADPRSNALDHVLEYAGKRRPKVLVLENVASLAHARHQDTRRKIADALKPHYHLTVKKLNSQEFNVPQRRNRIYIVAILKSAAKNKFVMPTSARHKRKRPVLDFLGLKRSPCRKPDFKTWSPTARSNYLAALKKNKLSAQAAVDKDLFIDLAASTTRRSSCLSMAPTITASHGASRAYYLTSAGCPPLSQGAHRLFLLLLGCCHAPHAQAGWNLSIF